MSVRLLQDLFNVAKGDKGFIPNVDETEALARSFGIHNLLHSHGGNNESYRAIAKVIHTIAAPHLLLGDVHGFINAAEAINYQHSLVYKDKVA